jgi:hypothetical protein
LTVIITTARPPLNLFEVVRLSFSDSFVVLYDVPIYLVPVSGPTPAYYVAAAAIITSIVVVNTSGSSANFDIEIQDPINPTAPYTPPLTYTDYMIVDNLTVGANSFVNVDLNRQVVKSLQRVRIKASVGATLTAHFSFVLNQREQFTIIP